MTNTGLMLIDIQNDYFPLGKMELEGAEKAVINAKKVLEFFRSNNLPIYHIQHISTKKDASFFLPESEGIKIHHEVLPLNSEKVITKHYPNSFRGTELLQELNNKEIRNLIVCGMMSHMCVDATVRAAFDLNFNCTIIEDACATRQLYFNNLTIPAEYAHGTIMAALNETYAKVLTLNEFLHSN